MAYEAVNIVVRDTSPLRLPIEGVVVRLFTLSGQPLTEAQTDVNGVAAFLLPLPLAPTPAAAWPAAPLGATIAPWPPASTVSPSVVKAATAIRACSAAWRSANPSAGLARSGRPT